MRLLIAVAAVATGLVCSCVLSTPDTASDAGTTADADSAAKPSPANAFPEGTVVAVNRDGEAVAVAALDAEDNPYRGQYGPWDEWVYEHYARDFDPSKYVGG